MTIVLVIIDTCFHNFKVKGENRWKEKMPKSKENASPAVGSVEVGQREF